MAHLLAQVCLTSTLTVHLRIRLRPSPSEEAYGKKKPTPTAICVIVKGCEYVLADAICNEGSKHVSIMKLKPLLFIKVNFGRI